MSCRLLDGAPSAGSKISREYKLEEFNKPIHPWIELKWSEFQSRHLFKKRCGHGQDTYTSTIFVEVLRHIWQQETTDGIGILTICLAGADLVIAIPLKRADFDNHVVQAAQNPTQWGYRHGKHTPTIRLAIANTI